MPTCIASYPPFFRPNPGVDPAPGPQIPTEEDSSGPIAIPVIDFEDRDPAKLRQACKEWGVFRLVNTGIPSSLLAQLLDLATSIFSLSFESKQAWPARPMLYFWGSPALTMSATAQQMGPPPEKLNWLEGLNVPLVPASHSSYQDNSLLENFRTREGRRRMGERFSSGDLHGLQIGLIAYRSSGSDGGLDHPGSEHQGAVKICQVVSKLQ